MSVPALSLLRTKTQASVNFAMANSLALSQLIDRQSELFIRISDSIDNLKKLGKYNINREVLEIRLGCEKIGDLSKKIT